MSADVRRRRRHPLAARAPARAQRRLIGDILFIHIHSHEHTYAHVHNTRAHISYATTATEFSRRRVVVVTSLPLPKITDSYGGIKYISLIASPPTRDDLFILSRIATCCSHHCVAEFALFPFPPPMTTGRPTIKFGQPIFEQPMPCEKNPKRYWAK